MYQIYAKDEGYLIAGQQLNKQPLITPIKSNDILCITSERSSFILIRDEVYANWQV